MTLDSIQKVAGWLLGVVVVTATVELMALPSGRWPFAERSLFWTSWLLPAAVVIGFVYVGLRLWRLRSGTSGESDSTRSVLSGTRGRLHLFFVALACVGLAALAIETWEARRLGAWAVHDVFRRDLGVPVWMAVHLLTATSTAFAFALGAGAWVDRFELPARGGVRPATVLSFIGGAVVWFLLVDSLGAMIVGGPVVFAGGGW